MKSNHLRPKKRRLMRLILLLAPISFFSCNKDINQSLEVNEDSGQLLKRSKEYFADKTASPLFNTVTTTYHWDDAEIVIDSKTYSPDGEMLKNDGTIEDKWGNYEIMQEENIRYFVKVPIEIINSSYKSKGKAYMYFYSENSDLKNINYIFSQYIYPSPYIVDKNHFDAYVLKQNNKGYITKYKNGNKSILNIAIPQTKAEYCSECMIMLEECETPLVFDPDLLLCVFPEDCPGAEAEYFLNLCPIHGGVYPISAYSTELRYTLFASDNTLVEGNALIPVGVTTINVSVYLPMPIGYFTCYVDTGFGRDTKSSVYVVYFSASTTLNPSVSGVKATFGFISSNSNGGQCTFYKN